MEKLIEALISEIKININNDNSDKELILAELLLALKKAQIKLKEMEINVK